MSESRDRRPASADTSKKGVGRGNGEGSKRTRLKPGDGGRKPGARNRPKLLVVMLRVFKRQAERDVTTEEKNCRAWLLEDRKGFMSHMAKLEEAHRLREEARNPPTVPYGTVAPPDEGSARLRELMRRLLDQMAARKAERDGTGPTGG